MSPSANTPFPGLSSPGAGFEHPFALLAACHDRVRQRLALLPRLLDHVAEHGADAQAQDAAFDVLRYFDIAAPHHHEDETRHVLPRLMASPDAALHTLAAQLQQDHLRMAQQWALLREPLLCWRDGRAAAWPLPAVREQMQAFVALYTLHLQREDSQAFPAAQALCDAPALRAMGTEMQARRHT